MNLQNKQLIIGSDMHYYQLFILHVPKNKNPA